MESEEMQRKYYQNRVWQTSTDKCNTIVWDRGVCREIHVPKGEVLLFLRAITATITRTTQKHTNMF